jgi:hypothetical protein
MTDYLRLWAEGLLKAKSLSVRSPITVVGERDKHLGPRWEFAKVEVSVEPAEGFEVVNNVSITDELKGLSFPDCVICGLLDVLMVEESAPLARIRLTLNDAVWSATDTSAMAFRQAGRDAGRKIIAGLKR